MIRHFALATYLMLPSIAFAQAPKAFVCDLLVQHSATMDPTYKNTTKSDRMSLTYAALDAQKATAQMIGNGGASNVSMIAADDKFQFIEITNSGNITVTTIFLSAKTALPAVHSRHMLILKDAIVSQYTGTCSPRF